MASGRVVEGFDIVESHQFGGGSSGREGVAEAFGLQRGHEAFGQGVVVGIGGAAHAQGEAAGGGEPGEVRGGVLDAAIAVMKQAGRRRVAMHGQSERGKW